MSSAAKISRKKGRIILLGDIGLEINRADFYEKELSFQVSCSYGPGRYDKKYEQSNIDYPLPFVRWTMQRNFSAFLDLLANHRLNVSSLITNEFSFSEPELAYQKILTDPQSLGIMFNYENDDVIRDKSLQIFRTDKLETKSHKKSSSKSVAIIGAGNFTSRVLGPALKKINVEITHICSSGSSSASNVARNLGIENITSDYTKILRNPEIKNIIIATPHNTHANMCIEALKKKKNIYVEKPLALELSDLDKIVDAYKQSDSLLKVGFNRRFSKYSTAVKEILLNYNEPKFITYNVNAGHLPNDHWLHDPSVGGGRIIGECCHFIDLCRFFIGDRIKEVVSRPLRLTKIQLTIVRLSFIL